MRFGKRINRPVLREMSGIENKQFIFKHAYLYGNSAAVILVDNGVMQYLSYGFRIISESFYPLYSFIGYQCFQIFCKQKVKSLFRLNNKISFNHILIDYLRFGLKVRYLDITTGNKPLRFFVKKQDGRSFKKFVFS